MAKVVVEGRKYDEKDMANWYNTQMGSFRSILVFGKGKNKVMGEGQSGGRAVSEIAKETERKLLEKYGEEEYHRRMDRLITNKRLSRVV
jgi:hypothetical protein